MKKTIKYLAILSFAILVGACQKESFTPTTVDLGGDTWAKGPIDTWIYDTYTKPYNIEVKYKWDRSEFPLNKDIVPVAEDKVIPVMEAVKKTWIEPYIAIKGEDFIKRYSHKQFVLAGSAEYNSNGTITLGTAEGGRKIVLMVLNDFNKNNKAEVRRMLKTIHHEFGHILQQNIAIQPDYQKITPDGYTAVWFNYTDASARAMGFITSYARAAPNEDFVEMLAVMLTEGKDGFDAIVNNAGEAGKPLLLKKKAMVEAYMKNNFGINVSQLQTLTSEAINNLQ